MSTSINSVEDDTSPLLSSFQPDVDERYRDLPSRPAIGHHGTEAVMRPAATYGSLNDSSYSSNDNATAAAVISRYKYYTKLAPTNDGAFVMPDHVVPVIVVSDVSAIKGSQPSWVTIFALWNTMMGTSLLSMPWAISQAGFACGIVLLISVAALMLYTTYRILHSVKGISGTGEVIEFSDVCRHYLGQWAEWIAFLSSLLTLLGGMIVYWILISNFLFNIVSFIYHVAHGNLVDSSESNDPICPHMSSNSSNNSSDLSHDTKFLRYWDQQKTVPFMLVLVILPLINFKSPTFFTKFNTLGTISVAYLVCFAMKNAISWGIHLEFTDTSSPVYVPEFKTSFPALTGVAALAFFVQNCVLSITRAQQNPSNNVRDLIVAYILVCLTYLYMGVIVYISFGLDKNCLEDNFLNNVKDRNVMAFIARIGLFLQMICVFPLLIYIFRLQFMNTLFGSIWPSLKHVVLLNIVVVGVCIVFAVLLPHIGKIIGFVGAFCGFSYAIALPCLVYMKIRYENGSLTIPVIIIHTALIIIGLANFIAQFLLL